MNAIGTFGVSWFGQRIDLCTKVHMRKAQKLVRYCGSKVNFPKSAPFEDAKKKSVFF